MLGHHVDQVTVNHALQVLNVKRCVLVFFTSPVCVCMCVKSMILGVFFFFIFSNCEI